MGNGIQTRILVTEVWPSGVREVVKVSEASAKRMKALAPSKGRTRPPPSKDPSERHSEVSRHHE